MNLERIFIITLIMEEDSNKKKLPFLVSSHLPKKEKGTFFTKIKKLLPFLEKSKKSRSPLPGRIHYQLQQDAQLIVEKLKHLREKIKNELKEKKEDQLWHLFETAMNPLLREYEKIEKKIIVGMNGHEEESSAIKSYNDWFEKAKFWVTLSSKPSDRDEIIKAVFVHTKLVLDLSIDRDLKTLREYKMHEFNALGLGEVDLANVVIQIEKRLQSHIQALHELKNSRPDDLNLDNLQEWKAQVDELRAEHYNAALHIIDDFLHPFFPAHEQEEEHLKEIFKLVAYLEEEIPVFLKEVETLDRTDNEYYILMRDHGVYLQEETHRLNLDLRLTPELGDRVQHLTNQIEKAMKLI